ncbi:dammarenediol 12-hydroxylase-like [Impatiens glandulifera]|uniref:dammarenediol 12-hydroxylase-like n=1 Tax=Impatiens glandulifera TaxID=253017 RepID=UPI001FB059AF|nr:dammarenediol 12-hydroxylase-like [Impatiens glandulifera]
MDVFLPTAAAAFLLVVIVTSSVFHILSRKHNLVVATAGPPHSRLPPGTAGWPFIGETLDYINKLRNGNLREFVLHRVKKYESNVFTTSIIGNPVAMLCGPEGNKLLFSNENKLVNIWFPKTVERIFAKSHGKPVGDDFAHVRNILRIYLMPSALQKHVGTIDSVTKLELEEQWKPNKPAIVHDLAGRFTLGVVCRLFLGTNDPSMIEKLENPEKDISHGIVSMPINFPGTTFNRALKAAQKLTALLVEVIKQRKIDLATGKACRTQDILSEMVNANDGNGDLLKETDIAAHLIGLIHGGYDPVRSGLTFIVKYMAELPEVYDQVFREQMEVKNSKEENEALNWEDMKKMKYSWNVIQEVFRLMPPVLGTFRRAIKDFTFGDHTIPKGYKIHWTAYYTHKDPKYFPNPEKFDPSRFDEIGPPPFSYVPFGGGPRMCPGIEYTKMVTLVFIHNIVTKYKWELLVLDEKVVVDPHPRPTQGLPVHLRPHQS